jgi:hypothetical protein
MWRTDLKERIHFYTADWTLYTTLRQVNAFTTAMTLHYISSAERSASGNDKVSWRGFIP